MQDGGEEPVHPPEGWYPDNTGQQRYWDGAQWTEHVAPTAPLVAGGQNSTAIATGMHVASIFFGFIPPLIGYLAFPDDQLVREHSRNALNFQLTVLIGYVVSILLIVVLIGFFTAFAIGFASLVLHILGAIAASKGERYEFPLTLNLIKGDAAAFS